MFHARTLTHFAHPQNVGELVSPALTVEVSNPACGDVLRLSALCVEGRVKEVRFKTRGCTAAIAAGSALTTLLLNRPLAELNQVRAALVEEALGGLPVTSKHVTVLCADAVQALMRALPG